MADRSYTILKGKNGLYTRIELGEAIVQDGDTLHLEGFLAAAGSIWEITAVTKLAGATVTITHAAIAPNGHLCTVTAGAGAADCPIFYMAYGVKA